MFGNETLLSSVCKKIFRFQGNRCKITWGTRRRAEDDISQHVFVPRVPVFISNWGAVRRWCAGIELTPPPRPIHGGMCKDARPFRCRWLITARGVPAKVVLGAEEGQGYQEKTQVLLMRSFSTIKPTCCQLQRLLVEFWVRSSWKRTILPEGSWVRCFPGGGCAEMVFTHELSLRSGTTHWRIHMEGRLSWMVNYFTPRHFPTGCKQSFSVTQSRCILSPPTPACAPWSSFWALLSPSFFTYRQWRITVAE